MNRDDCPDCRRLGGPCLKGGLAGLSDEKAVAGTITDFWTQEVRHVVSDRRIHGWKDDTTSKRGGHITVCDIPTKGTCTVGTWCQVTCRACWQGRSNFAVQLSLFGD